MNAKLLLSVLAMVLLSSCASDNLTVKKPTFAKDEQTKKAKKSTTRTRWLASEFR